MRSLSSYRTITNGSLLDNKINPISENLELLTNTVTTINDEGLLNTPILKNNIGMADTRIGYVSKRHINSIKSDTPNHVFDINTVISPTIYTITSSIDTDGYYVGWYVGYLDSFKRIVNYVGSTKEITIDNEFDVAPIESNTLNFLSSVYAGITYNQTINAIEIALYDPQFHDEERIILNLAADSFTADNITLKFLNIQNDIDSIKYIDFKSGTVSDWRVHEEATTRNFIIQYDPLNVLYGTRNIVVHTSTTTTVYNNKIDMTTNDGGIFSIKNDTTGTILSTDNNGDVSINNKIIGTKWKTPTSIEILNTSDGVMMNINEDGAMELHTNHTINNDSSIKVSTIIDTSVNAELLKYKVIDVTPEFINNMTVGGEVIGMNVDLTHYTGTNERLIGLFSNIGASLSTIEYERHAGYFINSDIITSIANDIYGLETNETIITDKILTKEIGSGVVSKVDISTAPATSTFRSFSANTIGTNTTDVVALYVNGNMSIVEKDVSNTSPNAYINISNTERTLAFSTPTTNSTFFISNSDDLKIGYTLQFNEIIVTLEANASSTISPVFEYSSGDGLWTVIPVVDDETNGFSQSGIISISGMDGEWTNQYLGLTGVNKYWIRITRTADVLDVAPREETIFIIPYMSEYWDTEGTLSATSMICHKYIDTAFGIRAIQNSNISIEGFNTTDGIEVTPDGTVITTNTTNATIGGGSLQVDGGEFIQKNLIITDDTKVLGGITDTNVTTPISFGDTSNTSIDTTLGQSTVVGGINAANYGLHDQLLSGFGEWSGSGDYYDKAYLASDFKFRLLRPGYGYINSKKITWISPQETPIIAKNTSTYVCIDNTGTLVNVFSHSEFHKSYVNLWYVYRGYADNFMVFKENHHYGGLSGSLLMFNTFSIGIIIDTQGAIPTKITAGDGTDVSDRQIKIVGDGNLTDSGMLTIIPDTVGLPITFKVGYINDSGVYQTYTVSNTEVPMYYSLGGIPTILDNDKFGIFAIGVGKTDLNTVEPQYILIMHTEQFLSTDNAIAAINNNGEIPRLFSTFPNAEMGQLGFIIVQNNGSGGIIYSIFIEKSSVGNNAIQQSSGVSNASSINLDTDNFDRNLSVSNTTVQLAMNTLDDIPVSATGIATWSDTGDYYSISSSTFNLLRGGTGYINGKIITWTSGQSISTDMYIVNYLCINNNGILVKANNRTDAHSLYIPLFMTLNSEGRLVVVSNDYEYTLPYKNVLNDISVSPGKIESIIHVTSKTSMTGTNDDTQLVLHNDAIINFNGISVTAQNSYPNGIDVELWYYNASSQWAYYNNHLSLPLVWNDAGTVTTITTDNTATYMSIYLLRGSHRSADVIHFGILNDAIYDTSTETQSQMYMDLRNKTNLIRSGGIFELDLVLLCTVIMMRLSGNNYITDIIRATDTLLPYHEEEDSRVLKWSKTVYSQTDISDILQHVSPIANTTSKMIIGSLNRTTGLTDPSENNFPYNTMGKIVVYGKNSTGTLAPDTNEFGKMTSTSTEIVLADNNTSASGTLTLNSRYNTDNSIVVNTSTDGDVFKVTSVGNVDSTGYIRTNNTIYCHNITVEGSNELNVASAVGDTHVIMTLPYPENTADVFPSVFFESTTPATSPSWQIGVRTTNDKFTIASKTTDGASNVMSTYLDCGNNQMDIYYPLYANLRKNKIITISQTASDRADYNTIMSALTGESPISSVTVFLVYPGTYSENVTIQDDNTVLYGVNKNNVIIDGIFETVNYTENVIIQNITIDHSEVDYLIRIKGYNWNIYFIDCIIKSNHVVDQLISMVWGDMTVTFDNTKFQYISSNIDAANGTCIIFTTNFATLIVKNCDINVTLNDSSPNTIIDHMYIFQTTGGNITAYNNNIIMNTNIYTADSGSSILYPLTSESTNIFCKIEQNTIKYLRENVSDTGGSIIMHGREITVTTTNKIILSNNTYETINEPQAAYIVYDDFGGTVTINNEEFTTKSQVEASVTISSAINYNYTSFNKFYTSRITVIRNLIGNSGLPSVIISSDDRLYYDSSSINDKNNVRQVELDPRCILKTSLVIFDRIPTETTPDATNINEVGYIAEEMMENAPNAVCYDEKGKPIALNGPGQIMYLTEIIKKQQATLEMLVNKLDLKSEMKAIWGKPTNKQKIGKSLDDIYDQYRY